MEYIRIWSPVHITVSLNDKASSNMVDSSLENVALSTDGGLYAHRIAIRLLYSCKHPAKYTQATLQIFSS